MANRIERLLPIFKCLQIAVFNVHENDKRKARKRIIAEFGRDIYDNEVKPKMKTGIMEIFSHKPTRPLKRFAWYCAFSVEQRVAREEAGLTWLPRNCR